MCRWNQLPICGDMKAMLVSNCYQFRPNTQTVAAATKQTANPITDHPYIGKILIRSALHTLMIYYDIFVWYFLSSCRHALCISLGSEPIINITKPWLASYRPTPLTHLSSLLESKAVLPDPSSPLVPEWDPVLTPFWFCSCSCLAHSGKSLSGAM